ncbi:hypothetical protein NHQ30_001871 [Ciborinia camelliae]|nr:hypothetical protein NHQ30_001871 [Ciborinia camelliae]
MIEGKNTVLITGASGSLAIPSVQYLLTHHPTHNVLLTIRNPSVTDPNTRRLLEILSRYPENRYSIRTLDLSFLNSVQRFTDAIKKEIAEGKLQPLGAIICNAFTWSINRGLKFSSDGYENCMAPEPDKEGEETGRGFQRYGLSKAMAIMGMWQLNARLQKSSDPQLRKITALAMDPGGLPDSRCMSSGADVPAAWTFLMKGILGTVFLGPLRFLFKYAIPTLRSTKDAAVDLVEIAIGEEFRGESGYYTMLNRDECSPETRDEEKQVAVWRKSLEWAGVKSGDMVLVEAFE